MSLGLLFLNLPNYFLDLSSNSLPNLIIIGANKAGTSSLHAYLSQHPDIFMCYPKEPMFFLMQQIERDLGDDPRVAGDKKGAVYTIEQYMELFIQGRSRKIRGESSTAYLANPLCASRIKSQIQNVKLIAVLREPVDRAFSNYKMYVQRGFEKMSFEKAIEEEMSTGRLNYPDGMRYLSLSRYSEALVEYKKYFDEDHLKIFLYDDFRQNPLNMIKEIFNYLDVDSSFEPNIKEEHNVSVIQRFESGSRTYLLIDFLVKVFRKLRLNGLSGWIDSKKERKLKLRPETKMKLKKYFSEEVRVLERITGKDLTQWKR